jgi:predicted DNA-binding antitoxin AbrB/MazE fold protein
MTITAKYEDGVFKPLEDVSISEGTIVEVRVPSHADCFKGKARSVGDFASTACGRTGPTSATALNTSATFDVTFGAERFPPPRLHALPHRQRCPD